MVGVFMNLNGTIARTMSDLLDDADQVGSGAQVGHVQDICEG